MDDKELKELSDHVLQTIKNFLDETNENYADCAEAYKSIAPFVDEETRNVFRTAIFELEKAINSFYEKTKDMFDNPDYKTRDIIQNIVAVHVFSQQAKEEYLRLISEAKRIHGISDVTVHLN